MIKSCFEYFELQILQNDPGTKAVHAWASRDGGLVLCSLEIFLHCLLCFLLIGFVLTNITSEIQAQHFHRQESLHWTIRSSMVLVTRRLSRAAANWRPFSGNIHAKLLICYPFGQSVFKIWWAILGPSFFGTGISENPTQRKKQRLRQRSCVFFYWPCWCAWLA